MVFVELVKKSFNMNNQIYIKSVAENRIRLKSDIFSSKTNISLIKKEFKDEFTSFRNNLSCKSIVFTYSNNQSLEEILEKLNELFNTTHLSLTQDINKEAQNKTFTIRLDNRISLIGLGVSALSTFSPVGASIFKIGQAVSTITNSSKFVMNSIKF